MKNTFDVPLNYEVLNIDNEILCKLIGTSCKVELGGIDIAGFQNARMTKITLT